jgi:RsiW-degrading membrane proteinase PrsW (M82 family)
MLIDELYIALSVVAGLFCIAYLRRYDIHEREPFAKMLLATVWGGFWSAVISSLLYASLLSLGSGNPAAGLRPLLIIGPVEESAKLLAFFSVYPFIRREMDEPADGMVYMACVALGFSVIENYFYIVHANMPGATFVVRLLLCTPLHIIFSAGMGLAFYNVKTGQARWWAVGRWWLLASIAHGVYDFIVFNHVIMPLLLLVIMFLYETTMRLLGRALALSPHRMTLADFVASYEAPTTTKGLKCLACGSEGDKLTYHLGRIRFQKCDRCSGYVTTKKSLYALHQHFGSLVRGRIAQLGLSLRKTAQYLTLSEGNFFTARGNLAYFDLERQNESLERLNQAIIEKDFRRPRPRPYSLPAQADSATSPGPPASLGKPAVTAVPASAGAPSAATMPTLTGTPDPVPEPPDDASDPQNTAG